MDVEVDTFLAAEIDAALAEVAASQHAYFSRRPKTISARAQRRQRDAETEALLRTIVAVGKYLDRQEKLRARRTLGRR